MWHCAALYTKLSHRRNKSLELRKNKYPPKKPLLFKRGTFSKLLVLIKEMKMLWCDECIIVWWLNCRGYTYLFINMILSQALIHWEIRFFQRSKLMFTRSCGKFVNSIFFAPVQNICMDYVTKVTNLNGFKKHAGGSNVAYEFMGRNINITILLYIWLIFYYNLISF